MADDKNFQKTYTKKRQRDPLSEHGKLPPQAVPLEEAVLGALMLDKDAVALIIDILRPASFYRESHQQVYKAICALFEKSHPIDLLTVTEELKKMGKLEMVGGPYQLVELTNRVASSANIEFHARIIAQKFIQRELIRTSTEIIHNAYEDTMDVFDLLDTAEQGLFNITEQNLSRGSMGMSTLVNMAVQQLEEMSQKEEGLTGVPTGFIKLDELTSGWQPSDLIIIAARPGMGKCLGKGTLVLCYDGQLRPVEDIRVGDLLMGDDSTPRRVGSIARGREQMYWIHQECAQSYRVNESHILALRCQQACEGYQSGDVLTISVRDWLAKPNSFHRCFRGYKVGVDFEHQDLPSVEVPCYWAGLHLAPLMGALETVGAQGHASSHWLPDSPSETLTSLVALRTYCTQQQQLPAAYLTTHREQRAELLAGWLDVAGIYCESQDWIETWVSAPVLAKQLKFLGDSLGLYTHLTFTEEAYRLRFGGLRNFLPCRRHPLYQIQNTGNISSSCSSLITVEKDVEDDYYGFTIDGNHLFLLEDLTVTHNTSFTMAVARNAAIDFGKGVAFFSLEMSSLQLVNRLISMETEIASEKLRKGRLEDYEWQQLHAQVDKLSTVPLYIDDTPGISIFELRAKCRRLKMQHDIQMIIIDYLQLMTGGGDNKGNREQEISMISRGLKGLAKELNVPVIALSQLSRAVETRGGSKRPQLSDLRECITGDTLIYKADTGTYQRVDELVTQRGFKVLAMDEYHQLQEATCSDVWETGEKEIFEVTTRSGYTIKTSANHPFYTIDGWKELREIQEGNYVATPRAIAYDQENETLRDEEIILLAHLIGSGYFTEQQSIHYTCQESASLDVVEACVTKLWGIQPHRVKDTTSKHCYHIYLPSPYPLAHGTQHPFSLLLERVGLSFTQFYEKRVPSSLFSSSKRQVALFLRHLWSTNRGTFIKSTKGSSKIHYSSDSRGLVQDMQTLLLRFGIGSSIQKAQKQDYRPSYRLNIAGKENILKHHKNIGIHGNKALILEELALKMKAQVANSNVVPKDIWSAIRSIQKNQGFTEHSFQRTQGVSSYSSTLCESDHSEKTSSNLTSKNLEKWTNSALRWEKIISIKPIGKAMTYDIHVNNYHNFVANHFIVHNSGAIEQDADIVSFIYRPEYYQILEDEDGNSLKGIGEIIVAKHRNGALDSVRLKWDGQYAKFSNLDDEAFTGLDDASFFDQAGDDFGGQTFSSKMNEAKKNNDGIDDIPF